jgi:hypothetical protein
LYEYKQGKIDWTQMLLGSETIVSEIGSIIRHPIGINLASSACDLHIKYIKDI